MIVEEISVGHGLLEAPRWHDGKLYASDFFAGVVYCFDDVGNKSVVCEVPNRPSGLGWTPDGDLLVVSMLDRQLLRLSNEKLAQFADLEPLATWYANDMAVDSLGGAYVGNFGWDDTTEDDIRATSLIRVSPQGEISSAAEDLVFPNGIVISPEGDRLLVAETFAARITSFDRAPNGTLSNRQVWADFSGNTEFTTVSQAVASGAYLPDGIALAPDGTLWVADAAGQGAIHVAEGGEVLTRVSLGSQTAYAVALGGQDMNRLFICAAQPYGSGDPNASWESRLLVAELVDS